jgi:hypothetical protein
MWESDLHGPPIMVGQTTQAIPNVGPVNDRDESANSDILSRKSRIGSAVQNNYTTSSKDAAELLKFAIFPLL